MMDKNMDMDVDSLYSMNHSKCMLAAFQNFRQDETMLDVTLVCEGKSLKAHKLVLSSFSQFFKELFSENPCNHPIVLLRHFDFDDLKAIIDFIYKGKLSVPRERLMSTLKMAEDLNIRGLIPTNKEKYKKVFDQVSKKLSSRKKRKRHRHNSTDSEESDYKVSNSDKNIESEADNVTICDSQAMDIQPVHSKENVGNDSEIRPLVLRVGDLSTSNEESCSKPIDVNYNEDNLTKKNLSIDMPTESLTSPGKDTELKKCEAAAPETIELNSEFEANSENSDLAHVPGDGQNNFQGQSMESVLVTESLEKQPDCLSPRSLSAEQSEETRPEEEGKRFVCPNCNTVFTSRINFMRHRALCHISMEKSSYECQYCFFTTEDAQCLKQHSQTHTDNVPFKCGTCSEEFTSEEVYQKHIALHEVEEIALHGFSAVAEQDLFSKQNKSFTKNIEFRCSICFLKFSSKLRCQIHEKTCQGGS